MDSRSAMDSLEVGCLAGSRLRSISCPFCAGPLAVTDPESLLTCQNCGNTFLVASSNGYAVRYLPATVQRLQAVGAASKWLAGHQDTPKDIKRAVFTEAHLLYIPIWLVEAYVAGWEFGKKVRTKQQVVKQGDNEYVALELVEEGVQEGSFRMRRLYQAATDLSLLGIGRPQMSGREPLLPYVPGELERDAAVLEADRDYEDVVAQARHGFRQAPEGSTGFARFDELMEKVNLVYYPIWSLHYRYRDRLYQMTVDGRTGEVHSARAPAGNARQLAAMLASYTILALALAVVVWTWLNSILLRGPAQLAAIVVVALAAGACWRFSLVNEVEYHEPFSY